jgi:hypothetical protein
MYLSVPARDFVTVAIADTAVHESRAWRNSALITIQASEGCSGGEGPFRKMAGILLFACSIAVDVLSVAHNSALARVARDDQRRTTGIMRATFQRGFSAYFPQSHYRTAPCQTTE